MALACEWFNSGRFGADIRLGILDLIATGSTS